MEYTMGEKGIFFTKVYGKQPRFLILSTNIINQLGRMEALQL